MKKLYEWFDFYVVAENASEAAESLKGCLCDPPEAGDAEQERCYTLHDLLKAKRPGTHGEWTDPAEFLHVVDPGQWVVVDSGDLPSSMIDEDLLDLPDGAYVGIGAHADSWARKLPAGYVIHPPDW